MADNEKNYTSKVKIGNVVYYIKDSDAYGIGVGHILILEYVK